MATYIGLDVGTHAVRAVELSVGRGAPEVRRVGQVALPMGAVEHGEVVDVGVVAEAIRQLWREVGFSGREVVVGVANQRLVVRQADVPRMSEDDLRASLEYQVQELIPIPVAEAHLDVLVLDPGLGATGDTPTMKILLVAAQRDMVANLVAAAEAANLRVSRVDVGPFALIRSLASDLVTSGPGDSEAIVDLGAGVTTVVVQEQGIPQFVRLLTQGGADVTREIAESLSVDLDVAEDLKRRATPDDDDPQAATAASIRDDRARVTLDDVRGSLDFFLAQSPTSNLSRIIVTGASSRVPGLVERLGEVMDCPTSVGEPFLGYQLNLKDISAEQVLARGDEFATALGLALAGLPVEAGDYRVSLLPAEVAVARAERRQVSIAAAGVGVFAVLLIGAWLVRGAQVSRAQDKADAEEARTTALQADIAKLSDIEALAQQASDRRELVAAALADDVAWTRLFQEVATVIPSDVWLTTFNGTAVGETKSIVFAGQGFDHTSAARWLLRVADLPSITGLWLSSSTKGTIGAREVISFSSNAILTPAAHSDRLERFQEPR